MRLLPVPLITIALAIGPSAAIAADSYVDVTGAGTACTQAAPCPTIALGIDAAGAGDTVHVANGNYAERVTLADGKSLDGSGGNTIIDASANTDGQVSVTIPAGPAGEISGFVFQDDGAGEQYAIRATSSSPTITSNDFRAFFRAVSVLGAGADGAIISNDFSGVHSATIGSGTEIDVEQGATAQITANDFHDPGDSASAVLAAGGGVTMERNNIDGSSVTLSNTTVASSLNGDRVTGFQGGAAVVGRDDGSDDAGVGDIALTNVTLWDNATDVAGLRNVITIDSSIVQDPVNTFPGFPPEATCAIQFSRGPTTSGTSCQQFQTSSDPAFAGAGDYHLTQASPLVDAGNPAAASVATDLDGDPRVLDGPDGASCVGADAVRDMGSDEFDCRPRIAREVTLKYAKKARAFKGKVTAPDAACAQGREVSVYKRRDDGDRELGTDVTSASGKFKVPAPRRKGRYHAEADSVELAGVGICDYSQSPGVRLR